MTAGFLAALTTPLIVQVSTTFLMGSLNSDLALAAAALVAGPLLGGSVGLGLWRAVLVKRVVGGSVRPAPVALGVAAGLVLGEVASLAHTGTESVGGVTHPPALAVVALGGLGATALVAGLAELWADAAPAARRPRGSWPLALTLSSVVFAVALWVGGTLELALDQGGWLVARAWMVTVLGSAPVLAAVAVLAASAAWALLVSRPGAPTPTWLLAGGERRPWPAAGRGGLAEAAVPAVAVGLVAAGAMVAPRRRSRRSTAPAWRSCARRWRRSSCSPPASSGVTPAPSLPPGPRVPRRSATSRPGRRA